MSDLRKLRKSTVNTGYILLKIPVIYFIKQIHSIYLYGTSLDEVTGHTFSVIT